MHIWQHHPKPRQHLSCSGLERVCRGTSTMDQDWHRCKHFKNWLHGCTYFFQAQPCAQDARVIIPRMVFARLILVLCTSSIHLASKDKRQTQIGSTRIQRKAMISTRINDRHLTNTRQLPDSESQHTRTTKLLSNIQMISKLRNMNERNYDPPADPGLLLVLLQLLLITRPPLMKVALPPGSCLRSPSRHRPDP